MLTWAIFNLANMTPEEIKETIDLSKVLMDKLELDYMDESASDLYKALSYYVQVQENKLR